MDHRRAAQLLLQPVLHVIDDIVELQQVAVCRNLGVEGDHHPAGAVVVYHQVVDVLHLGIGADDLLDLFHKFRFRGLAQQGGEGLLGGLVGGKQDEQRHQHAHPAIDMETCELPHQGGCQHGGGGHGIRETVRSRGAHGSGLDLFPNGAVIKIHVQLHCYGQGQYPQHQRRGGYCLRVQDFLQGGLGQLHTHKQDQPRHHQAGYVLHAPVAEGMLRVRLAPGQAEAQQRHQ